tara:strand:+ start:1749 stop:4235 length:2487 start_codon:yes stop_codon:yes gene_type:complete
LAKKKKQTRHKKKQQKRKKETVSVEFSREDILAPLRDEASDENDRPQSPVHRIDPGTVSSEFTPEDARRPTMPSLSLKDAQQERRQTSERVTPSDERAPDHFSTGGRSTELQDESQASNATHSVERLDEKMEFGRRLEIFQQRNSLPETSTPRYKTPPKFRHTPPSQRRYILEQKDFDQRLAFHHIWLQTDGMEGERVDLSGFDLSHISLAHKDLERASISGAKGVTSAQLAGCNLYRVTLPEKTAREIEDMEQIRSISVHARILLTLCLLLSVYSFLVLQNSRDIHFLLNLSETPLPFVGVDFPIVSFCVYMPMVLCGLFVYFHLYLQKVWESLAIKPAIFPGGQCLDQSVDGWLLMGVGARMMPLLRTKQRSLRFLRWCFACVLGWVLVPLFLLFFVTRCAVRHDLLLSSFQISLWLFSLGFSIYSYRLAKRTLEGAPKRSFWKMLPVTAWSVLLGFAVPVLGLLIEAPLGHVKFPMFNADFTDQDVSARPDRWDSDAELLKYTKGAQLQGRNLKYLQGRKAFLVNADLRSVNLQHADLRGADLRKAMLEGAKLQHARLSLAQLQGANLQEAFLDNTDFSFAKMQGADLAGVKLNNVNFLFAKLQQVNLSGTQLKDVDLSGVDLQGADLRESVLHGARLVLTNLQQVRLHGADCTGADLSSARLQGADVMGAVFAKANLYEAELKGVQFGDVDLRGAKLTEANLQWADLSDADIRNATFHSANMRGALFNEIQRSMLSHALSPSNEPVCLSRRLALACYKWLLKQQGLTEPTERGKQNQLQPPYCPDSKEIKGPIFLYEQLPDGISEGKCPKEPVKQPTTQPASEK